MGKYTITVSPKGKYHFNLAAGNGEIILTSQMYAAKNGAVKGIESVAANAPEAPVVDTTSDKAQPSGNPKFEIYLDKANEYRFRLIAKNGKPIGASEGYADIKGCKAGITSVKKNAGSKIAEEK